MTAKIAEHDSRSTSSADTHHNFIDSSVVPYAFIFVVERHELVPLGKNDLFKLSSCTFPQTIHDSIIMERIFDLRRQFREKSNTQPALAAKSKEEGSVLVNEKHIIES